MQAGYALFAAGVLSGVDLVWALGRQQAQQAAEIAQKLSAAAIEGRSGLLGCGHALRHPRRGGPGRGRRALGRAGGNQRPVGLRPPLGLGHGLRGHDRGRGARARAATGPASLASCGPGGECAGVESHEPLASSSARQARRGRRRGRDPTGPRRHRLGRAQGSRRGGRVAARPACHPQIGGRGQDPGAQPAVRAAPHRPPSV